MIIFLLNLLVKKIKIKNGNFKNVKGIVGFIERYYYGSNDGSGNIPICNPYYGIYLPKYNLNVNVDVSYIKNINKNKLQSKDMVLVCYINKNKYVIPIKLEDYIIK